MTVVDLGPLADLLADPAVSDLFVNGGTSVWVERAGRLEAVPLTLDDATVHGMVERVIGPLGLRLDRSSPMVDARLPDGSRLHAVMSPVAIDGTCVAIRRFRPELPGLDGFGLPPDAAALLEWAVVSGWNLLVSGGTGAGKTTLLNTLSASVPAGERVVTIEETAELRLPHHHVVRLEARPANGEGAGAVSVRDLVRAALRLRPDRLLVGEVRGGEAFDLVQALNTGHAGSLSTIHANDPDAALTRLESLILLAGTGLPARSAREQGGASIDAVVHVARRRSGERVVESIAEVAADGRRVRLLYERTWRSVAEPHRPARRPG